MLKILQTSLQQYMNWEPPDVQAGCKKSRGTRDQIANIHWIIEKASQFQKNITDTIHILLKTKRVMYLPIQYHRNNQP